MHAGRDLTKKPIRGHLLLVAEVGLAAAGSGELHVQVLTLGQHPGAVHEHLAFDEGVGNTVVVSGIVVSDHTVCGSAGKERKILSKGKA